MRAFHAERITWSIGPALLVAAFGNAALALQKPSPAAFVAALAGFAVLAVTAFVQIPLHARLTSGEDPVTIARLNANETARALLTPSTSPSSTTLTASSIESTHDLAPAGGIQGTIALVEALRARGIALDASGTEVLGSLRGVLATSHERRTVARITCRSAIE